MNDQHTKIRTIDQHLPKFRSKCGTFDLGITVTQWKSPAEHRYHFQLANADIWEIQKWAQLVSKPVVLNLFKRCGTLQKPKHFRDTISRNKQ